MKFSIRYITTCFLVAATLSSCVVGKKYEKPLVNLPDQYRGQVKLTGDTTLLEWAVFFKDPLLLSLIDSALQRNYEIGTAALTLKQLDLSLKQARVSLLPTLNLLAAANRNYLSKNSLNGSLAGQVSGGNFMDDYSASLSLSWEVDIWGKSAMRKAGAKADFLGQTENIRAVKTRIIAQVAQAYYNLIGLDEQLKIADQNVLLSDSTLNMVNLQFSAGQINSLVVEQIKAQKNTAELLVPLTKQNIEIQENSLSILCGRYPDRIQRAGQLALFSENNVFTTGVPTQLLSRRPDVKAAEFALISAHAKTGLAKAAMYPSFNITAQSGANSFKASSWFNLPASLFHNLGVNLTQPVFQRKELSTAYQVAQLEQEKSVINFKQTVLNAVGEVSNALSQSQHTDERLEIVSRRTASLNKARADALMLYKNGMATYLEVISAQNNSLQNDLEAVTIKRDKLIALTDLYRALGGG
jgi:multidrug efflux system outer membrane protein